MITYLYHKKHNVTGLNYFGKTTRNPYTYTGSGVYWKKHLDKHGKDIETVQVWQYEDLEECKKFAIDFSIKNNIVESTDWANLVIENGIDGQSVGFKNPKLSEYNRKHTGINHRSSQPGFIPNRLGQKDSEETKIKKRKPRPHFKGNNNPLYGVKLSEEQCNKLKGPRPHTAGKNNSMFNYQWSETQKALLKEKRKGKVWWHNHIICTMAVESPGTDFVRGRLPKRN